MDVSHKSIFLQEFLGTAVIIISINWGAQSFVDHGKIVQQLAVALSVFMMYILISPTCFGHFNPSITITHFV